MVQHAALAQTTSVKFLGKLLVATDGSESGERAVSFAINLAKAHASTIEFCDAVDLNGALLSCCTTQGESALMMPLVAGLEDNGESVGGVARALALAAGVVSTSKVLNGRSVAAILDCANNHHFDAVVVGTAGKVGMDRVFFGSTADGVVRRSTIPVFVVPPGASVDVMPFQKIVVALDDSVSGDAALNFSIRLAASDDADLTICTAVEAPHLALGREYYVFDPKVTIRELQSEADRFLTAACDEARDRHVRSERYVLDGRAADAILAMALEKGADAIVVGTHGRRGLGRLLLGSVAEAIMRRSHVPVIVVRSIAPSETPKI